MTIQSLQQAAIVTGGQTVSLGQVFATNSAGANPSYVVLSLLDRNEYTIAATRATGTLGGNGRTLGLTSQGGDARGAGLAFAYQASTGRYLNATYGYLDQLSYTASASRNDVTDLTLYGTSDGGLAAAYAASSYGLMQNGAFAALGTVTVATQPGVQNHVGNATPNAIAAAAQSFVGQAWNDNGCWVLASTIAAQAGSSLPVQSTAIGIRGVSNGAWYAAFNGTAGQTGDWKSMVHTGDVIVFGTAGGGGHITTCVAGSGASAMLVDNITYVNSAGQVQNSAKDGSASDILIAAPHLASQEFNGVSASSVVVYSLDTPTVTDLVSSVSLTAGTTRTFSSLFSVAGPQRSVTQIQAYDSVAGNKFTVNGVAVSATSAATAVTAASLAALSFAAGTAAVSDTIQVRAYNGSYWGDWQSLGVTVTAGAPPAPPPPPPAPPAPVIRAPVLVTQTANVTIAANQALSLTLPAITFRDPQNQALTYSAAQSSGAALPSWLRFDAARDSFSGTAPITPQTVAIRVTATDTSGLSASEVFQVSVTPPPPPPPINTGAPKLLAHTPDQNFGAAHTINWTLPTGTFGGAGLRYAAYELSGAPITQWLHFNGATGNFWGTAPNNFSGSAQVQVVAMGSVPGMASETFTLRFGSGSTNSIAMPRQGMHLVAHFV